MNIDDYETIGKRVQWARLDNKMTQEYVAEQLGVGSQHISNIERGIVGISFEAFYALVKLLNCSADYLLFGDTLSDNKNPLDIIMGKLDSHNGYMLKNF